MRHAVWLVLMVGLVACGGSEGPGFTKISVDQVPAPVMRVAQDTLVGVSFDRAIVKKSGVYELAGADAKGVRREVEITPLGDVVEIE